MALMVESGFPGCRAVAMARLNWSTAACRPAETSAIVCDTSVAVSIARSAVPGWDTGWGVSIFTIPCPKKLRPHCDEAATFGYPRVRSF